MNKNQKNITVISNIVLEPFLPACVKEYFRDDISLSIIPYDEYMEKQYRSKIKNSDLIPVWINLEHLVPDYNSWDEKIYEIIPAISKFLENIQAWSTGSIITFSFEDYSLPLTKSVGNIYGRYCDKLNSELFAITDEKNITLIDIKKLIAEVGCEKSFSIKGKYRWNAPYSKELIQIAAKEIYKQYLVENGKTKKCLVLDCDNVLWGGILSEDGLEGISLSCSGIGRYYQDFQRFVLSLYLQGVILAVCSKNDMEDVLFAFRSHSGMILKTDNIACFQVNWDNKAKNIMRIAEILNIGLDSMVFVDDSAMEIEEIKTILPDVATIQFRKNMSYDIFFNNFNLKNKIDIQDIEKRNETYRTNKERKLLLENTSSYNEYIDALKIELDIHKAETNEYNRIAELTQRVNKCTNGKRYLVAELQQHLNSDMTTLYSVYVADRFSDLGLVGAIEISGDILSLFSLSCRALGRGIENEMVNFIKERHQVRFIKIEETGKNDDTRKMLQKAFI
ncbi:MAG: HAD-IIIC family phosphatase [Emergencia sp.]|nr:HAD-IIIC family phosphatase [Emergencia sp.]